MFLILVIWSYFYNKWIHLKACIWIIVSKTQIFKSFLKPPLLFNNFYMHGSNEIICNIETCFMKIWKNLLKIF